MFDSCDQNGLIPLQGSETVKAVKQSRRCHSQGGVAVKVVIRVNVYYPSGPSRRTVAIPRGVVAFQSRWLPQRRWSHSQGGVTVEVVSQPR